MSLSATTAEVAVMGIRDDPQGDSNLVCPPQINILPPFPPELFGFANLDGEGVTQIVSSGESRSLFARWARIGTDKRAMVQAEISLIQGEAEPCIQDAEEVPRISASERPSVTLLTTARIEAVQPASQFRGSATISEHRHSAFAIVNPSTEVANITVTLLDANGEIVEVDERKAEIKYLLRAEKRIADFVWSILFDGCKFANLGLLEDVICIATPPGPPPLPASFNGSLRISSDIPIAVAGLDVLLPEGKLVNIPISISD